jgi:hypothetical protein
MGRRHLCLIVDLRSHKALRERDAHKAAAREAPTIAPSKCKSHVVDWFAALRAGLRDAYHR